MRKSDLLKVCVCVCILGRIFFFVGVDCGCWWGGLGEGDLLLSGLQLLISTS